MPVKPANVEFIKYQFKNYRGKWDCARAKLLIIQSGLVLSKPSKYFM